VSAVDELQRGHAELLDEPVAVDHADSGGPPSPPAPPGDGNRHGRGDENLPDRPSYAMAVAAMLAWIFAFAFLSVAMLLTRGLNQ
jgi:hypothetical protein